jgi:hypothetical protein
MWNKTFLIIPTAALVIAVTAQAAAASTHRHARMFAAMSVRVRNSNAYAAPDTENIRGAASGMYRANDLNVYRDGQPGFDIKSEPPYGPNWRRTCC